MPISSTAGTSSSGGSGGTVSGAKWTAPLSAFTAAITATTQDTAAALSVTVTTGQVVRYRYEVAVGVNGNNMPLYFTGATISSLFGYQYAYSSGALTVTSAYQASPISGTAYGINYTNIAGSITDYDVLTSSAGTLTLSVGMINSGNTVNIIRRASIQIIG